jgi:hypothetical protein
MHVRQTMAEPRPGTPGVRAQAAAVNLQATPARPLR